jgi:hypothetical protein
VKWIWKISQEPEELWFKLVKAKYMPEGSFFIQMLRGAPSFGRGCTKSSISLNEVLFLELEMGLFVSFGWTLGYTMFLFV